MKKRLVIIGNGVAGSTLALKLEQSERFDITLISDESPYFFSRTALMYVYMGHMKLKETEPYPRAAWDRSPISRIRGKVHSVDLSQRILQVDSHGEKVDLGYDTLVVATGSKPAFYGWPGEHIDGVLGLYHLKDLEQLEKWAPNEKVCPSAVIIGGGLIGIELAEMLLSRGIQTTLIIRESHFWASQLPTSDAELVESQIAKHHLNIIKEDELSEIIADTNGKVARIITKSGRHIDCNLVGITTGVTPNIDFLKDSGLELGKGILVNSVLQTTDPNVYAIGDCAELREPSHGRSAIEAVWYTGRLMAETLANTLAGVPTHYNPGVWFNSAKFFDLEYQTYGSVLPESKRPSSERHFHWRSENEEKAITLAYHRENKSLLGVNSFGIRLSHTVFDRWIQEQRQIDWVIEHLKEAHFDPEFSKTHYTQISDAFVSNH